MQYNEDTTILKGGNIPEALYHAPNVVPTPSQELSMMFSLLSINRRAVDVHARNVAAGWWTDIKTKESILTTRNRAELLMLVVSEISEAFEGIEGDLFDDKLPHLKMFDVELADVAIRLLDMIGAEISVAGSTQNHHMGPVTISKTSTFERDLMLIVNHVSAAMEHIRKNRIVEYRSKLYDAIIFTFAVANKHRINLYSVIDEKTNFNANRPDHKLEARLKDGGKKF